MRSIRSCLIAILAATWRAPDAPKSASDFLLTAMRRNYSGCFSPKEAMKILYLCFDPSIDLARETGGAVHIRALIRALTDLGHDVMTICTCVSRRLWVECQVGGRVAVSDIAGLHGSFGSA